MILTPSGSLSYHVFVMFGLFGLVGLVSLFVLIGVFDLVGLSLLGHFLSYMSSCFVIVIVIGHRRRSCFSHNVKIFHLVDSCQCWMSITKKNEFHFWLMNQSINMEVVPFDVSFKTPATAVIAGGTGMWLHDCMIVWLQDCIIIDFKIAKIHTGGQEDRTFKMWTSLIIFSEVLWIEEKFPKFPVLIWYYLAKKYIGEMGYS